LSDEQLKRPLANLSTTHSSLPTGLFGQNLAQSRNNNYDTDTRLFKSFNALLQKIGPKQKNYIPSLRLHLCCIKHPTFTQANQFTPINQKLIKKITRPKKFRLNYTNRLH
jgi:hypothetical protein